jgi:anthranilate phosphoribosyltransferase
MIRGFIEKLVEFRDLSPEEASSAMHLIMQGAVTPAQMGSFLTALRMKGETTRELAAFAQVMRSRAVTITPRIEGILVDTCGTGGDGAHTFNISTAAAFVAAGAGIPIVKHGNRKSSSRCGSADVLEELGLVLTLEPDQIQSILETQHIAFLFAPLHHPAMRSAAEVRREIGIRSAFNLLGPLSNPAGVQAQVVGVYAPFLTEKVAEVLTLLGSRRAMVVHGDGLDEITTLGDTKVSELKNGIIANYILRCSDFGIEKGSPEDLRGGDAKENARIILEVLGGERGAHRDIVIANAGAAIYVGEKVHNLGSGFEKAKISIDSGMALETLSRLIDATKEAS